MRKGSPEIEIEIEVDAGSSWLTQAATTPTRDKDWNWKGSTGRYGTQWYLLVIRSAVTTGLLLLGGLLRGDTAGRALGGGTRRESSCTLRWGGSAATAQLRGGQILAVVWPGICLLLDARVFDAFDRLGSINGAALPVMMSLEHCLSRWQCRAVHRSATGEVLEVEKAVALYGVERHQSE